MLLTGIVAQSHGLKVAGLICSILSQAGKKVSMVDLRDLAALDPSQVKGYTDELERSGVSVALLKIRPEDVDEKLLKGLRLEIILYADKADNPEKSQGHEDPRRRLLAALDEKGTVIVNVDDAELIKVLEGMQYHTVTYGFNSKASITASSIGDEIISEGFLCCLQRKVSARNGTVVEPQEYRIPVKLDGMDPYCFLAATAFSVVNGIDLNSVFKIM